MFNLFLIKMSRTGWFESEKMDLLILKNWPVASKDVFIVWGLKQQADLPGDSEEMGRGNDQKSVDISRISRVLHQAVIRNIRRRNICDFKEFITSWMPLQLVESWCSSCFRSPAWPTWMVVNLISLFTSFYPHDTPWYQYSILMNKVKYCR